MRVFMVSQMRLTAAIFSLSLPLLIGCGFSSNTPIATSSGHVSGKVFGGQNPISGSTVTVWQVGSLGYGSSDALALATTTSAADGTFDIPPGTYTCPTDTTQVYITAAGGEATPGYSNSAILLATGLGNCASAQTQTVEINEVTTVVTAYALESFYTYSIGSSGNTFGSPAGNMSALALSNAHTIPTLINLPDGTVNPDTATVKIEAAKIYSLANALAACVNSTSTSTACTDLFNDAIDPNYGKPTDTLQAVEVINFYPYQNVAAIYDLGVPQAPFVGLSSAPNDWTIGVSYTTSALGLGIAGTATSGTSSTIDIDTSGRVWVPSNAPGETGVGYFDPSTNTFTGPINATGITLTQPQYVAIDESGYVWVTDALSANIEVVDSSGMAAPIGGTLPGAKYLGPVSIDDSGDAFLSYTDSSGAAHLGEITPGNTPATTFTTLGTFIYPPTGLNYVVGSDLPFFFASTSGSTTPCLSEELDNPGSVPYTEQQDTSTADITQAPYTSSNCISGGTALVEADADGLASAGSDNVICSAQYGCFYSSIPGFFSQPEGLATDGYGDEWNANAGNASVGTFYPTGNTSTPYEAAANAVPYLHGSANGATMTTPYGVAIDGSGNLWVSNASCVTNTATLCTPTAFVLSELIGVAGPTITPLANQDGGVFAGTEPPLPAPAVKGQPMYSSRRFSSRHSTAAHPGFVFLSPTLAKRATFNSHSPSPLVELP
jgi:hypothetical protein